MDLPTIPQLREKIVAGQRRKKFLKRKIDEKAGTETSLDYDRAEVAFINASIEALEFVEIYRWPDMSPVVALERLLEALHDAGIPDQTSEHDAVSTAMLRARRAIHATQGEQR